MKQPHPSHPSFPPKKNCRDNPWKEKERKKERKKSPANKKGSLHTYIYTYVQTVQYSISLEARILSGTYPVIRGNKNNEK